MKVIRKYDQFRRDCKCDMECESCGEKQTYNSAYDDRNFWDNVVPSFKCKKCGKSTNDLGLKPEPIGTKYSDYEQV
jgi:hypothetical protein